MAGIRKIKINYCIKNNKASPAMFWYLYFIIVGGNDLELDVHIDSFLA